MQVMVADTSSRLHLFFFFQAEDGIRDYKGTGVQTCALPISLLRECTLEKMEEAGSGGTAELNAWVLVMAFTRGPADVLAYMPAVAWRSGTGMEIGRASGRERGEISVGAGSLKKKKGRGQRGR